ncbi:MAG: hypothetical protein AABY83_15445 [Pseudomonadota bacterium]
MASFVLGWYVYEINYDVDADWSPKFARSILLGMDLPMYMALLWALGILSLFVRIAPRALWLQGWYNVRISVRVVIYSMIIFAIYGLYRYPARVIDLL